jgi:FdhE protein
MSSVGRPRHNPVSIFREIKGPAIDADDAARLALDLLVRELGYRRGAVNPFLVGY